MSELANPAADARAAAAAYTAALLARLGGRDPLAVARATPDALRRAVAGLSARQLGAPEAPGKWSVAQVLYHLADSELVSGYRFRMILAEDRPPLQGYDQDRWVARLHPEPANTAAAVADALEEIAVLRRANLRLLERASAEDHARVGLHSERGEESLGHLVRLFAGHDVAHLQQLERIRAAIG